jgi:hypothetical protein
MSSSGAACAYEYEYEMEPEVTGWEPKGDQSVDKRIDDPLRAEITRAQEMIGIPNADEDSLVYSRETINVAIEFLRAQSAQFHKMYSYCPPVPLIGPGPDGSVDLHWKQEKWELLVNIPAGINQQATFYGDDYGIQMIKGTLSPKKVNYGIIAWLTHK